MAVISGTTITMTRGDTERIKIDIFNQADGSMYRPDPLDTLRFAVKKNYDDDEVLVFIDIPIDTMILTIRPEDTKFLDYGTTKGRYKYDVQLTTASGDIHTVIPRSDLIILEEVD